MTPQRNRLLLAIAAVSAFASVAIIAAGAWDAMYHGTYVVDTFWSPPHVLIYVAMLSTLVAGIILAVLIVVAAQREGISVSQAFGAYPLVTFQLIANVGFLAGGPLDEAWHAVFGRDAFSIYTVPHATLSTFLALISIASVGIAVDAQRTGASPRLSRTVMAFALAGLVANLAGWIFEWGAGESKSVAVIANDWLAGPVTALLCTFAFTFSSAFYQRRWTLLVVTLLALSISDLVAWGLAFAGMTMNYTPAWILFPSAVAYVFTIGFGRRRQWPQWTNLALFGGAIIILIVLFQNVGLYATMTFGDILWPLPLTFGGAICGGSIGEWLSQRLGAPRLTEQPAGHIQTALT
jgi:hypothetical protein